TMVNCQKSKLLLSLSLDTMTYSGANGSTTLRTVRAHLRPERSGAHNWSLPAPITRTFQIAICWR
ncbi:hypothetical protein IW148_003238, partial [Coemansia sp. RSA 1199]